MAYLFAVTTCATRSQARKLADLLLEKRLAACVTVSGPVQSYYRWQGKKRQDREFILFIKTSAAYSRLEKIILANHPYSVPELIAWPFGTGHAAYLKWLRSETSPGKKHSARK